ncbi:hypothetical protein MT325_M735L [Paramecium bursaria chlorella virus MT325]|uniref:Uncharacterized protein M735L n=1 Tax=Paramecium bursaria Chlorella virus MT325 TaxID=346932 RepID=A7IVB5_PBCVM|nr:hypothetical protein MT325_M735L [Paramecium bursaria chlorella virus MT325]AGE49984.1 hypothetical protein PBCVCan184_877L [Paramecium bursaria Chlorella virus Can18-4]
MDNPYSRMMTIFPNHVKIYQIKYGFKSTMANIEANNIIEVDDLIEEITPANDIDEYVSEEESLDNDSNDEEFDFDEEDGGDFIRVDDIGNSVERVVDVLGGIFVSSEGSTMADILTKISETLDRHVLAIEAQTAILEKQSKVLFRLSKALEKN